MEGVKKVNEKPQYKRVMYVDTDTAGQLFFEQRAKSCNLAEDVVIFGTLNEAQQYIAMVKPENFPQVIYLDLALDNGHTAEDFARHYHRTVSDEVKSKTKLVVVSAHIAYNTEPAQMESMLGAKLIDAFYEKHAIGTAQTAFE